MRRNQGGNGLEPAVSAFFANFATKTDAETDNPETMITQKM